MLNNILFSVISLLYSIMIMIIYFSKNRLSNEENKVYKYLIICNFFGLIIEVFLATFAIHFLVDINLNLAVFILKFILYYFIIWISLFTYYIYLICTKDRVSKEDILNNKLNKMKKYLKILVLISFIVITILPMKIHGFNYTYGASVNFVYIVSGILIASWFYLLIRNIHYIKSKKYTPVFTFIALGFIVMIIQSIYPELTLMIPMQTFITFLMYFTIENPDIKMLNELYKSKELAEQNYVDKYNFLFETAAEVRSPLKEIKDICNSVDINNKESVKGSLELVKSITKHLDFTINNILDISVIDINKLKIIDTKYSLENILEDILKRVMKEKNPQVKFEQKIPKNIPILYGDYIKLKQILYSILVNSLGRLKEGYLLFKVDILEKYDFCRIIFTISDNGNRVSIETINEILSATGEFSKEELEELEQKEINMKLCQKVVKIMGGSMLIQSNSQGTETKLVIDQRIYQDNKEDILEKYIHEIYKSKKILIISQDKELVNSLKRLCQSNNISYTNIYYGYDAVDLLKSGKCYDLILVSREMREMNGYETFQNIKSLNIKTPVIIILNDNQEKMGKHYIKDGFTDYLLVNNLSEDFQRIINKY